MWDEQPRDAVEFCPQPLQFHKRMSRAMESRPMNGTTARAVRFAAGLLAVVTLGWILTGQAAKPGQGWDPSQHGMPTDWTHQHVIFSHPATNRQASEALADPRYWHQWYRLHIPRTLAVDPNDIATLAPELKASSSGGFWSENMGNNATVGAGNYPAKYSFNINVANCSNATQPDFVVFPTRLASTTTQASLIAYDNLYSGCSGFGSVPTLYFAYNTTTTATGTVRTSPVFSLDGTQLAFVQTDGTHGTVVLLKWAANKGTLAAPFAPTQVTAAAYTTCTAPCMTSFTLRTSTNVQTNDITSSVFYDYSGDVAWVGDSLGLLHMFHPFFKGTPAEIRTSPWPVQVNTANPTALTSPVYDHISGNVLVGDAGGYFARVSPTGVPTVSAQIDHGAGIVAPPILDQPSSKVFVFASNDNTTNCGGAACSAVYIFGTSFAAGSSGAKTTVGASSVAPNPLYNGAFDSTYESNINATGNLYVCGNAGTNPTLYVIPISAGVAPAAGTALATITTNASTKACSPVSDIPNPNLNGGSEERVFMSAAGNGRPLTCGNKGCLVSLINTPWQASTAYQVGQEIFSPALHVEVAITAGTSGASAPTWTTTNGSTVVDGGVTWLDQGIPTFVPFANWLANHNYPARSRILDSNGKPQITVAGGRSGGTTPAWATTPGLTTTDNAVTWIEGGNLPTAAYQANGGTSAIIMDNVVAPGTMAGASQVYFSTLTNQACTTSGTTGGCAVQAAQSNLQ